MLPQTLQLKLQASCAVQDHMQASMDTSCSSFLHPLFVFVVFLSFSGLAVRIRAPGAPRAEGVALTAKPTHVHRSHFKNLQEEGEASVLSDVVVVRRVVVDVGATARLVRGLHGFGAPDAGAKDPELLV
jgi:hypothetical protein